VSAAISHLFVTHPELGHFVGVEHKLVATHSNEILTPDITAVYDNNSKGLLFELKYSLPADIRSVKDELMKLAKYGRIRNGWGIKGVVQAADFILVCHMDDLKRAAEAVQQVFYETQNPFYDPLSFSIWSWTVAAAREDERREEMRLLHAYGATRNGRLQQMVSEPGGILVPEEVLTMLRFTHMFIRQKPPVQYTIALLIQNVFSALPPPTRAGRRYYEVDLNLVYQKTNILFPPWWEQDVQTVQVKRGWIKEALDTLARLKLIKEIPGKADSYSIPIPTLITRKPLPLAICERLVAIQGKISRPVGRPPTIRGVPKRRPLGVKPITEYLRNRQ